MAATVPPHNWKSGFAQPTEVATWADETHHMTEDGKKAHYMTPPAQEPRTSTVHNSLGFSALRTWPTLYNGTESPHGAPTWWKPLQEVDVLICGGEFRGCLVSQDANSRVLGGPFGLEVALSLARQGVTFRIVGKSA